MEKKAPAKKPLTERERQELLKKYESGKKITKKQNFEKLKEEYIKQTDKNYKDGDRNWNLENM